LYWRWVAANALSEVVGLGGTFLLTGLAFGLIANLTGAAGVLASFAFAVLCGGVEATVVGLAQWWAMHAWFPAVTRLDWRRGTFVGALAAYVLGYLPSTLINLSEQSVPAASGSQTAMAEPPQAVMLLLAAPMGAVAGAVLSFAQWQVLRGKSRRAGSWIPANMLAWAAGMPVVFWAIDLAFKLPALWQAVLLMAAALLVTGGIVGAIHGLFLVRMVEDQSSHA
jgi:hypothetical protein